MAEVDFQSGRKEAAIATMKRCRQLEPMRDYRAQHLLRVDAVIPFGLGHDYSRFRIKSRTQQPRT